MSIKFKKDSYIIFECIIIACLEDESCSFSRLFSNYFNNFQSAKTIFQPAFAGSRPLFLPLSFILSRSGNYILFPHSLQTYQYQTSFLCLLSSSRLFVLESISDYYSFPTVQLQVIHKKQVIDLASFFLVLVQSQLLCGLESVTVVLITNSNGDNELL